MERCYRIWLSKLLIGLTPGTQNVVFPNQASRGKCWLWKYHIPQALGPSWRGRWRHEDGSRGGPFRQASLQVCGESRCLTEEQGELGSGSGSLLPGQWAEASTAMNTKKRLPKLEFTGKGKEMLGNCRDLPSSNFLSERVETKRKENISKKITIKSDKNYDRG